MKEPFRYIFIVSIIATLIISCTKDLGDLKHSKTITSGCLPSTTLKSSSYITDNVSYSIQNGNLHVYVVFHAGCCSMFTSSTDVKNGTIFIKINSNQIDPCNCICFFRFEFVFTGSGSYYNYDVTINDSLKFNGSINP